MTLKEIKPNILCLEYRQERDDEDFGTCMWARFYFNLDRYELTITSDFWNYGNYVYKWYETPNSESFLQLMARIEKGDLIYKLYGDPDVFDYEETKRQFYLYFGDEKDNRNKLDEIFAELELYGEPYVTSEFIEVLTNSGYDFDKPWRYIKRIYPIYVLKIGDVFSDYIQPYIRKLLKETNND